MKGKAISKQQSVLRTPKCHRYKASNEGGDDSLVAPLYALLIILMSYRHEYDKNKPAFKMIYIMNNNSNFNHKNNHH